MGSFHELCLSVVTKSINKLIDAHVLNLPKCLENLIIRTWKLDNFSKVLEESNNVSTLDLIICTVSLEDTWHLMVSLLSPSFSIDQVDLETAIPDYHLCIWNEYYMCVDLNLKMSVNCMIEYLQTLPHFTFYPFENFYPTKPMFIELILEKKSWCSNCLRTFLYTNIYG